MTDNVKLLLITGSVGVGKSTIADSIFEILKERSLPIALINLDEFGYANVAPDDPYKLDLRFKNLAVVWKNYFEAGVKYLVIPWVIENEQDIERFRHAIPEADVFVAMLTASMDTLKERLTNRHLGGSLDWHLRRAEELSAIFNSSKIADIVINTNNQSVSSITSVLVKRWVKV